MEENLKQTIKSSKVVIQDRKTTTICGVTKVYSSSNSCISLEIQNEPVIFEGVNLNITKLDVESGNVMIDGIINSMKFTHAKSNKNLIKRIFS